ncbi:hypothetical protein B0J13DRAFT_544000 [Dactylonectria estremocensis]|uniref:NADH dehydrogenase [ubiquinone] 1 beta subcomplex subunit 9 n=1 Tax=Dactylonectria estremocensis TaxID=1079267 RepID=A0A9P9F6H3_9HYPO|nr:hypothetical protein B0J13DRAFT_544000 [Dactylonectria estremocensis]
MAGILHTAQHNQPPHTHTLPIPSCDRQPATTPASIDQSTLSDEFSSIGPGHVHPHSRTMSTRPAALSLYRRSLKLALDWAVHRHLWRGQALYIRSLFEANRNVTNPRQQRALLTETEKLLDSWKHPDPYTPPTAPGGSKFERNLPSPILDPPPHAVNRH